MAPELRGVDPVCRLSSGIHRSTGPAIAVAAPDVGRHVPVGVSGSLQERNLSVAAVLRLGMRRADSGRQRDVGSGTIHLEYEHVGIGHAGALAQRHPLIA